MKLLTSRPTGGLTMTLNNGATALGHAIQPANATFIVGGQTIRVETNGNDPVFEQHSAGRGNRVNFAANDFFIRTDRARDQIVLSFTPAIDSAALQIAAIGVFTPLDFRAVAQARFTDNSLSAERSISGTTTVANGGAAVLGLQRGPAEKAVAALILRVEGAAVRNFAINQVTVAAAAAGAPLAVAGMSAKPKPRARVKKAGE